MLNLYGHKSILSKPLAALTFLSENRYLQAIRHGFTFALPMFILGSFGTLMSAFPHAGYQEFKEYFMGGYFVLMLGFLDQATLACSALLVLVGISFSLADSFSSQNGVLETHRNVLAVLLALACFFSFNAVVDGYLFVFSAGNSVIFSAIIVALSSTRLFIFFSDLPFFRPKNRFQNTSIVVSKVSQYMVPFMLVIIIFAWLNLFIHKIGFLNGGDFVSSVTSYFIIKHANSYFSILLVDFLRNSLWLFGIHGSQVLEPLLVQSYATLVPMVDDSPLAILLSANYTNAFIYLGGAGSTLSLVFAAFIYGKKNQIYRICLLSFIPSIFNINEIIIFGLPIVLNPFLAIPFIITPLILYLFNFIVLLFSPFTIIDSTISWATPMLLSGYLVTGSVGGAILQIFNLMIGILIYLPFIRFYDKFQYERFNQHRSELIKQSTDRIIVKEHYYTYRNDDIGTAARLLSNELTQAFKNNGLSTCYQPLVNYNTGKVINVESLIQWHHPIHGMVSSNVISTLAKESGLASDLTLWHIKKALEDLKKWSSEGHSFWLSINVPATEIAKSFVVDAVIEMLDALKIEPHLLAIEVNESIDLSANNSFKIGINRLIEKGVALLIDNFGFGHSCALYIREFPIRAIKANQSLINTIKTDQKSLVVLRGIIDMCQRLGIELIFDHVESNDQLQLLQAEGQYLFQGPFICINLQEQQLVDEITMLESRLKKGR